MTDATWKSRALVQGPLFTFDFNAGDNWDTGAVPTDTAFFGATRTGAVSFSADVTTIGGWTLNAGATGYGFITARVIEFTGAGIVINGGSATLVNNFRVEFNNGSTAGSAIIDNNGFLAFWNESTAGSAIIYNNGDIQFHQDSTPASASIANGASGHVKFWNTAGAGSAAITNDGTLEFVFDSTAGQAQIVNNAGGIVDFSASHGPNASHKLSAGSIAGAGSFILGPLNELTVGSNNLSTEVSGVISGHLFTVGGSLVKTGTGTLTLSGANTYAGATHVIGGTLEVDGSISDSATTVSSGGMLTGNGLTGAVTVASGGTLSPGGSTGILHTGGVNFSAGAHFAVALGGTSAGTNGYDQLDVDGTVTLGDATLDVSLINGFNPAAAGATPYLIIDNDGTDGVVGTFAGLAEGAQFSIGGSVFSISYHGGDGNDVVLTALKSSVTPPVAQPPQPVPGSPGDDNFMAPADDSAFVGGRGIDSVTFGFRLVDATITYSGNDIIIDGPNGSTHAVLTGIEVFNFTDGTVNLRDGSPLIDDLFYYAKYHDVWEAHLDADTHYNTFGWHEGRDPNAWFDTKGYLEVYADVAAAGANPLTHYDHEGWKEGRDPSTAFDTKTYLAHYPDVAAAHVDPLAHFMTWQSEEGRLAFGDGVWG